jgi:hypothetical protein
MASKWEKVVRPSSLVLRVPVNQRSEQQAAACKAVCHDKGHIVIEAVAGSGKTESLTHILNDYSRVQPDHSILCVAFGSDIKKALEARIPARLSDVKTCHGSGYGSQCRTSSVSFAQNPYSIVKHPKWGNGKASNLAIESINGDHLVAFFKARLPGKEEKKKADIEALCKLLSLGKTCLKGLVPVYNLDSNLDRLIEVKRERQGLIDIVDRFGIEFSENLSKQDAADHVLAAMDWTKDGPGVTFQKKRGRWSKGEVPTEEKRTITFDDQMWLPLINGWAFPQYDLILVDECQDLSPARLLIVFLSLNKGGRIVAVGDRHQAIFGFAGAETDALPNLIEKLEAAVMPLSVTYRCAQSIVREAQRVDRNIPIEARADAPEGTVDTMDVRKIMDEAKAGDAVISRTNAELVRLFFMFAKNKIRCVMLGKDYGAMLAHRIKGWKNAARKEGIRFDGDELLARNRLWFAERCKYLDPDGAGIKASQKERARDELETVNALCSDMDVSMESEKAVDEVLNRCYKMFSKDGAAKGAKDAVVLSSTHKFKGDERNRVFVLIETYRPGESKSGRSGEAQEETNLLYVAITRAQNHLTYVTGVRTVSSDDSPGGSQFAVPDGLAPDNMGMLDGEAEVFDIESKQD